MINNTKKFLKNENGEAIILFSLILTVMLGIVGVIIDGGVVYVSKSKMQKTCNAAALSGAQELFSEVEDINKVVNDILSYHDESDTPSEIIIVPEHRITVRLSKKVNHSFLKIFGINSTIVDAEATAGFVTIGAATGVAPLGIDESIPLEYGKEYSLKVDQTEGESGYFGVLALEGPGAALYEDNLMYGCTSEISIGNIIDTQTGNIAGKTRDAINTKINSCIHVSGDYDERHCSRILLVAVYKPYDFDSNQLKSVEVVGFAYFYISEPMSNKDTSINGVFIKKSGSGIGDENAADRGAYSIRLMK